MPGTIGAQYAVETVELPPGVAMEVGGMDFAPGGGLFVCTRAGDVWRLAVGGGWSLFARGLHEPLGLLADGDGSLLIVQRPELTRVVDEDGDGRADLFATVCAAWGVSDNYHEYAYGLVRGDDGSLYGTLNLAHDIGPRYRVAQVGGTTMSRPAKWRGWAFRVTPEGGFEPFASGLRSPAGIGRNAEGDLFVTDNQGDWVATSPILHIERGVFCGHPSSLFDRPDFAVADFTTLTTADFAHLRRLPAVWIPHGDLANSPGEPVFDDTGGRFGPFAGQMFVGDQTRSNVIRVFLEKVAGAWQGCVFPFVDGLQSGVVRSRFGPDGALWVGQTARGWGSAGTAPFGIQRLVWDGCTTPVEMLRIEARPRGFRVTFTVAMDPTTLADPASYQVSRWGYLYRPQYGSPPQDVVDVAGLQVRAHADGRAVDLELAPLPAGLVYRLTLAPRLVAADGRPVGHPVGWYTRNHHPDAER